MKKRLYIWLTIISLGLLAGCERQENNSSQTEQNMESSSEQKDTNNADDENTNTTVLTSDDIYINSFECGYISENEKPPYPNPLVIENVEQMNFAEERYGLRVPDDLSEEESMWHNFTIAEAFQEMKNTYPFNEYSYVVQYDEISSGGYYLHAARLIIDGNKIYFKMDDESYSPGLEDVVTDVMGGFCHMAAIPKDMIAGITFTNVIYPDANELTQAADFEWYAAYDLAGADLYKVYGDKQYIIHTQEEYENFLGKSKNIAFYERKVLSIKCDFDKASIVAVFGTRDEPYQFCHMNEIKVENGEVNLDYEMVVENPGEKTEAMTYMIYAIIPKGYLQDY